MRTLKLPTFARSGPRFMRPLPVLILMLACLACEEPRDEPGTPPCDEEPEPEPDGGVCCLCGVPGVPPAWCGPPKPDAESCDQAGVDLDAGWSEWHDECQLGLPCPGACEPM
jgi:hypothetical protein